MRNLAAIADALTDVPLFRRGKLVEALLRGDYLPALVRLFATVEDLESRPDLHHLYNIFKGALLLNDAAIYEVLLRDELVMAVFGALEYDPELADHADHREFLGDHRRFRRARARHRSPGAPPSTPDASRLRPAPHHHTTPHRAARLRTGDPDRRRRRRLSIHQNYHVAFLKDVVLPRALDDHTFAALNQITFVNNVQIVAYACNDGSYLPALKAKLDDASLDDEARLLAIRLLNELCGLAKQLQLYNRTQFYRRFLELGFFSPWRAASSARARASASPPSTSSSPPCTTSRRCCAGGSCSSARSASSSTLLRCVVGADATGERPQVSEVLRALLDEGMDGREQDEFLNLFYEDCVHKLAAPVAGKVSAGTAPINGAAAAVDEAADDVEWTDDNGGVLELPPRTSARSSASACSSTPTASSTSSSTTSSSRFVWRPPPPTTATFPRQ